MQANETHVEVELKDAEQSAQIVQFLVAQGVQIEEVRKGKASLEEAFLSLMEAEDVH